MLDGVLVGASVGTPDGACVGALVGAVVGQMVVISTGHVILPLVSSTGTIAPFVHATVVVELQYQLPVSTVTDNAPVLLQLV